MQKIKIREVHIQNPRMELEYYLLLKGGLCGIEIRDACDGSSAARFVPDTPERVHRLLLKLARGRLFPVHLNDVTDDYIYKNWSSQSSLQLLRAGADAGLDCGKRQGEKTCDLRAGIATNEG